MEAQAHTTQELMDLEKTYVLRLQCLGPARDSVLGLPKTPSM